MSTAHDEKLRSWLLSRSERGNADTEIDFHHEGDRAWTTGNRVRPLIHGATYFAELYDRIEGTRAGDLVFFVDWQGDADERLTGEPGSEVLEVFGRADERGVDVRGLVWRSHDKLLGFSSEANRRLGVQLQRRGAEVLLDMRVRLGGSHHQKFVVIRYADDPSRDIAYVGGIDLCHSRRDDRDHGGDSQAVGMAQEYGDTPPWHDAMVALSGPAVHDVETSFRERWDDPTPLSRNPFRSLRDRLLGVDVITDPLPEQQPPPPPVPAAEGGSHAVQILRTYPDLLLDRDYPFAPGGERSVARGYTKAIRRAQSLVYVEDQYLWGRHVGELFARALRENPDLHVIVVLPPYSAQGSRFGVLPQQLGRRRAMSDMVRVAPDRVAVYGIENDAGTPIYVHAKVCLIDDTWASTGSDNFNRRSWTHDSELSAVVVDEAGEYAERLRLTLAAEHLDRDPAEIDADGMRDCVDPREMFATFADSAARLDAWYANGQRGSRPKGRLRRKSTPPVPLLAQVFALPLYLRVHDPDGRPRALRRRDDF